MIRETNLSWIDAFASTIAISVGPQLCDSVCRGYFAPKKFLFGRHDGTYDPVDFSCLVFHRPVWNTVPDPDEAKIREIL